MASIGILLLSTLVSFIISFLLLMLTGAIFKCKKVAKPSVLVALILSIVSFFILLINIQGLNVIFSIGAIIFGIYLIKKFFKVRLGKSIGMFFTWTGLTLVILLILVLVGWGIVSNLLTSSF